MNTTTLNITLKSFKHIKSMSQETLCFTATVCLDGKPIGYASNIGQGGCTCINLNDAGRANPAVVAANDLSELKDGSLIGLVDKEAFAWEQAAEDARLRKRVAKDLATTVLFTRRGDTIGTIRTLKVKHKTAAETIAFAKGFLERSTDVECVFNLLPFEEAFNRMVKNA